MEKSKVVEIIKANRSGKYIINVSGNNIQKRLFVSDGKVCEFAKRSKKYGWAVSDDEVESWESIEKQDDVASDVALTAKYKRLAQKASFSSPFIRKCLSADETKTPYENRLTTGCQLDGKVITLKNLLEKEPYYTKIFLDHIKNRKDYHTYGRFEFRGYEASFWVSVVKEDNTDDYYNVGDVCAGITLFQKRGAKEYAYLLINDETFIGYDVD